MLKRYRYFYFAILKCYQTAIQYMGIDRFQAIKTDVLLIVSFITGDKTEFLSPMMFSNEYITGV